MSKENKLDNNKIINENSSSIFTVSSEDHDRSSHENIFEGKALHRKFEIQNYSFEDNDNQGLENKHLIYVSVINNNKNMKKNDFDSSIDNEESNVPDFSKKQNYNFYQRRHYLTFFFYVIIPIILVFTYSVFPLYPQKGRSDKYCIDYYSFLFWYRGVYLFIDYLILNAFMCGILKNNILIKNYSSFIISFIFTVVDSLTFHFLFKRFPENIFVKVYIIFIGFFANSMFYIIIDQVACLKYSRIKNSEISQGFIGLNDNNNNNNNNNNNQYINNNNYCGQEEFQKEQYSNANGDITNVSILHQEFIKNNYSENNNNLFTLHDKYLIGGKLKTKVKQDPSYKEEKEEFLVFYIIITFSLLSVMYLFCSSVVANFIKMQTFLGKNITFILFYLGWFILSRLIQLTLRNWNMKYKNGVFFICLAVQQFFHTNYRVIFLDKNFTPFDASFIIVENTIIEFLEFFIPLTTKFFKLRKLCPWFLRIIGYEGNQEYLRFKVSFNYFMKLLSLILSILGTLAQFTAISLSNNKNIYNLKYLDNMNLIVIKMGFTLLIEFLVYLIIEILMRKYYKISSWKNYYICLSNKKFMFASILMTIHILQDPIFTLINQVESC